MTDLSDFKLESRILKSGYHFICGIDEVGRGCLFGPVVAAACILDPENIPEGIKDSKKLSPGKREKLYDMLIDSSLSWAVGEASNIEIDKMNIAEAAKLAMNRAVDNLSKKPDFLLIDAVELKDLKIKQKSYIKRDEIILSISAASIIAKVTRDRAMLKFDEEFPMYNLKNNKGYPTAEHRQILREYGPTKFHRHSFKGV